MTRRQVVLAGVLCLLLLAGVIGGWSAAVLHSQAAAQKTGMTFAQFAKAGAATAASRSTFQFPRSVPPTPKGAGEQGTNYASLLPSAQPATMQPISQSLSSAFVVGSASSATAQPLDLKGSDGRFELIVPAGSLNLSHATVSTSSGSTTALAVGTALTLHLSQLYGHFANTISTLGVYQVQVTDSAGHAVSGITLRTPATLIYHYQPGELEQMGFFDGQLYATWPKQLATARAAKTSLTPYILPMHLNATARTLTAQTTILGPGPLDTGTGNSEQLSPPTPHFASVQGNSGQLGYSYPLQVPPGPAGFAPQLALNYSSADPNTRYDRTQPASDEGEGWSLSLGSISAEYYPSSSADTGSNGYWYFLSGVDNVSDRLVPNPHPADSNNPDFVTQQLSYLRIREVNASSSTPCWDVWDKNGTFYELGCTSDSRQYRYDSTTQKDVIYAWDVDRIVAPNEGSGYKIIAVSYYQDCSNGNIQGTCSEIDNTIRDAAMQQIVYGYSSSSASAISTVVGTVDFSYLAPLYPSSYSCPGGGGMRCDDPTPSPYNDYLPPPSVLNTLTLQSVTSYVGNDSSGSKAYGYNLSYQDSTATTDTDPISGMYMEIAGEHLLTSITPIVYQSGTAHTLKPVLFGYNPRTASGSTDLHTDPLENTYYDENTQATLSSGQQFSAYTAWQYLTSYFDSNTGIGEQISYERAYGNTHGTPTHGTDDRTDPFYCDTYPGDCTGSYAHPDDRAWTVEAVTSVTALGQDSSALAPATTSYHYQLAVTGSSTSTCTAYNGDDRCVGDNWTPLNSTTKRTDSDWQDYYHAEYRGFNVVYTTSPANDLTVDDYFSTAGWQTAESNASNYNAGSMYREDVYAGNSIYQTPTLRDTYTQYTGYQDAESGVTDVNSCNGNYDVTYAPCEVIALWSQTTQVEGNGSPDPTSQPWIQTTATYDDYSPGSGLTLTSGVYHNLLKQVTTASNAPTVTQQWVYTPNDQTISGTVYYDVDKVTQSETQDSSGYNYDCSYTTYDETPAGGAPAKPIAGWPTTVKTYSSANCSNPGSNAPLTASYTGYDSFGNVVASVDGVGAANSNLYSSTGCTPAIAPSVFPSTSAWSSGLNFTSCMTYSNETLPTAVANAFGQTSQTAYDATQGDLPISVTDANGQTTTTSYSYDSNSSTNNKTVVSTSEPGSVGSYTKQSYPYSDCSTSLPTSAVTPCFHISSKQAQSLYPNAVSQVLYDSLGRVIQQNSQVPTPAGASSSNTYYQEVFTDYDDSSHTVFQSVPFIVSGPAGGLNWVDPLSITDYQGNTPKGTVTSYDALGRVLSVVDALGNTTTTSYNLGQASGDSTLYASTTATDANGHVSVTYTDALGRTRYVQFDSGTSSGTLTPNEQKSIQYNVLNEPTSVTVTDLAPQSGQTITSVTTTASYDDLGRLVTLNDPDRGTHQYSYDANGNVISDVSGSRAIGYNYDLLGRVGCINDVTPPVESATGACTSGSHPYVQNTYDTNELGTQGSSDYPIGQLTQSMATTYFPEGTSATTTEQMQYDQRGRLVTQTMQIAVPSAWHFTSALPTYQMTQSYNDADQPTTTQTSMGSTAGYVFTDVYDSTTGALTGLSNVAGAGAADLVSQSEADNSSIAGGSAMLNQTTFNFVASDGSPLAANQLQLDLAGRPNSTAAMWQSGSGQSGTIFSQSRTYDGVGNVISLATTQAAASSVSGSGGSEVENFCYDEQNRLVWAGNTGTTPGAGSGTCGSATPSNSITGGTYSTSYAYTHLGQLWQGPVNGTGNNQYLYCDSSHPHQLTGVFAAGSTCSSQSGQLYASSNDAWGNVTSRSYNGTNATLSYDLLNNFVEWNAGTGNQEWNVYDAAGQRVLSRAIKGSATTVTTYPFGLEDHQYNGKGVSAGVDHYYYSLGGQLIGELNGNLTEFFLTDGLGSILSAITNKASNAIVKGNQGYEPYGTQQYAAAQTGTNKGYTGQYNDPLTGLDNYVSRYYDPVVGVFLSADTAQGNLQGVNPYAYVGGNPETMNDPSGHCPWCIVGALVGAVVGAGIDYGVQVYNNYQSGNSNPWTSNINWWQVGGAALTGALIGATLGAAAPALTAGAAAAGSAVAGGAGVSGAATLGYAGWAIAEYGGGDIAAATANNVASPADSTVTPADTTTVTTQADTTTTVNANQGETDISPYETGAQKHIFEGEVNSRGKAVGYHWEGDAGSAGQVRPGTQTPPDARGVYQAQVEVDGVPKKGFSTFFPSTWSKQEVLNSIDEAYSNRIYLQGNTYAGETSTGMIIQMFLNQEDEIKSAFPWYEPKIP